VIAIKTRSNHAFLTNVGGENHRQHNHRGIAMTQNTMGARERSPISDVSPEIPMLASSEAISFSPSAGPARGLHAPTEEQIRARAYERYLERGQEDGRAEEDWLAAERDLNGR
jgi:hypothetical protein